MCSGCLDIGLHHLHGQCAAHTDACIKQQWYVIVFCSELVSQLSYVHARLSDYLLPGGSSKDLCAPFWSAQTLRKAGKYLAEPITTRKQPEGGTNRSAPRALLMISGNANSAHSIYIVSSLYPNQK